MKSIEVYQSWNGFNPLSKIFFGTCLVKLWLLWALTNLSTCFTCKSFWLLNSVGWELTVNIRSPSLHPPYWQLSGARHFSQLLDYPSEKSDMGINASCNKMYLLKLIRMFETEYYHISCILIYHIILTCFKIASRVKISYYLRVFPFQQ